MNNNDAHLHLLVNHFPILGIIFGIGILISGFFLKNKSIKNVAYFLFIIAAIFAFFSMSTGEGAEEIVEDLPNIGHKIIHEHEEIAEKFSFILYILGVISILGLYTNIKNHSKTKIISLLVFSIAIIALFLAIKVGISGGEIRHTEIRNNQTSIENNTHLGE